MGRLLESNGVVRSAKAFELYARRKSPRTVQAGEYFFDHGTSAREVFWKLAKGEVYEQPFTVHEGDTMFDIAESWRSEIADARGILGGGERSGTRS